MWSVLSRPLWPRSHRMCVIANGDVMVQTATSIRKRWPASRIFSLGWISGWKFDRNSVVRGNRREIPAELSP